ncbi:hypothetical protein TVAG_045160 [Trichomonas vaginalis G3]|uniref:Right handed beta helix domain-containing protein n=1 Tax=Trichomonas vaginalis (strain ATCC PRA-98 / G3) TaxID=412133 RepID=A2E8G4_TRIV3|nr:hypothetical protein TVAGG3_0550270 [Trichomonas vaginalis G3]EAY11092.1 hypothetical protein TVAG_045160 [Trichomonas vaginalis G3]KAI5520448.1 hypothetical protein TVAGG3_0550270 [Trichomonas vaginalis G3]|eukprot:XP_001323315.1 hypothetical protein [Trichomonas vaginalis G3]
MSKANECFLYNCIFIDITTQSAIYFTNANNKFLNSYCSFNNCSSNTDGGSIYFKCESSIVQYRTCGYKSKTNSYWGHHSYTELVDDSNNKNYFYESSVYECGNLEKTGTNCLRYGNVEVKSINTSFCEAEDVSGIFLEARVCLCNITYSSFCNTTSSSSIIGLLGGNINLIFCNVLNNEQNKSRSGTLRSVVADILIENCSFLGNTGPGVEFYQDYDSPGSITVKDSFCDRIDKVTGSVTTNNVQNTSSIQKLSHFSSYICEVNVQTRPHSDAFYHPSYNIRRVH